MSVLAVLTSFSFACAQNHEPTHGSIPAPESSSPTMEKSSMETATLAGGCFWCIEAVFQRLEGVDTVISGYTGGSPADADYKKVSSGKTRHAEACQITYDDAVISYDDLLHVFFTAHDPTTLDRQGNDVGPQYRSAIFYHSEAQKQTAESYIKQLSENSPWENSIVTEINEYTTFYTAEEYHQNYYNRNGSQSYCSFVVRPKVEKFMKTFSDKIKAEYK